MNEITITFEDGTTQDFTTDLAFMEFIGKVNNLNEDDILQEMFEQRFILDHATNTDVVWYHDGKTIVQKVSIGRVRRYDLTNF